VERDFISSKDSTTITDNKLMFQTNYNPDITQDIQYFDITTKRSPSCLYDRIKHNGMGYNEKLHRDDREHAKSRGLYLHEEERKRTVPATSNAMYGHRTLKLEKVLNKHNHVEICRQDFKRVNGVNFNCGEKN